MKWKYVSMWWWRHIMLVSAWLACWDPSCACRNTSAVMTDLSMLGPPAEPGEGDYQSVIGTKRRGEGAVMSHPFLVGRGSQGWQNKQLGLVQTCLGLNVVAAWTKNKYIWLLTGFNIKRHYSWAKNKYLWLTLLTCFNIKRHITK